MNQGPARIEINEVGPRDGLQIEKTLVSTDDKVAFVDALSDCGFARIEVTSFTSPKAIPALADAVDVMRRISRRPGVIYTALVPNVRGLERALEAGTDEMNLVMSCSETHNRANLRMTRAQSFAELSQVLAAAANAGAPCNVSLSTAFGCPFDGDVPPGTVLDLAARLVDAGAAGITLCDTTGMAFPTQVGALCEQAAARLPATPLTVHSPTPSRPGRPASPALTRRRAAWADVLMRRAPAATSIPRNWSTCSRAWTCRPACRWNRCSLLSAVCQAWFSEICPTRCCRRAPGWPCMRRRRGWRNGFRPAPD